MSLPLPDLLFQCLRHFVPGTVRLRVQLFCESEGDGRVPHRSAVDGRVRLVQVVWPTDDDGTIARVISHMGLYEEDAGR